MCSSDLAIAVVGAVLAAFVADALPGGAGAAMDQLALAVASGSFDEAARMAPSLPAGAFAAAYGTAFRLTMLIAGGITFAAAVVTFVALVPRPARRRRRGQRMLEIEA